MYSQLSIIEVVPPENREAAARRCEKVLEEMSKGQRAYIPAAWKAAEQYLDDLEIWAIRKAEARGWTNVSSAFHAL